jgi:cell division protease FtsH
MSARFRPAWLEGHRVFLGSMGRDEVVGIGHVLTLVDALVARLRHPERAAEMGVAPPRGVLFWGPPGTGKTYVGRYVAASLGPDVPLYEVSADELTPERIRGALRYLAEAHPRSVVYLDECDTFGTARPFLDADARLLLTATLAALDGLVSTAGPVVIAASNTPPDALDRALVRAGRLGYHVRFDLPDEDERVALLALFTRPTATASDVDWRHLARLTRGRTPADLRQLVDDAAGLALAADRRVLSASDLLEAVRRSGEIEPELPDVPAVLHRVAVHEAGHVAVCVALRGPAWVYAVRTGPFGGTTAYGDEDVPLAHRPDDELRDSLAVAFGGAAAERAILGEPTLAAHPDMAEATELALERITAGIVEGRPPIDLDHLGRNVARSLKEDLATALAEPLGVARSLATTIVAANHDAIEGFAADLEAAHELTGEALVAAIEAAGFRAVADR